MGAILLDTTVLIDALRGRSAADRIRKIGDLGDVPYVCAINVEEVFRGLRPEEEPHAQRLINGMRTAPLGPDEGRRAGTWRRRFAARGRTLSQADCLVAAAALSVDARLATANPKDFPMRDLRVEHWPNDH
ncbi:MAG: PIN domain-containing protein [Actinomycetota bacterium]